jgi:MFS family permease
VLFALAHTQTLEYFSNQHQYYLHGFAQADVGLLKEDWFVKTKDPTPVYSAMVGVVYKLFGPFAFHVIYFVLLGTYFESVRRIIGALPGFPNRGPSRILFLTLFLAAHAAILRVASVRLTGYDYPWFLQAGLAAQYLLGPGLQPSVFGILLIVSLAAFTNDRPILAATLAAGAAVVHSTYLLPAGLITLGYLLVLFRDAAWRTAFLAGALALLMVLPIVVFNARTFLEGDAVQIANAQSIFAKVRIPHHTQFDYWFDAIAAGQLAVMFVGLILIRRTRLFLILLVPTVGSTTLGVIQVLTESDALALLFPWRFSTVLMPLSIAIVFAKLASLVTRCCPTNPSWIWAGSIVATSLAIGGIVIMVLGLGFYTNDAELPLLGHVREHKRPGDVYLLPVKFPTIKREFPGSASKTYAPPVRTGAVGIPVDLQRFRLSTGAPIYVDFKSPPYAPVEVIEWHRRMSNAQRWNADRDWDTNGYWKEVRAEGITHVVVPADKDVKCEKLRLVFGDESYRLYEWRE